MSFQIMPPVTSCSCFSEFQCALLTSIDILEKAPETFPDKAGEIQLHRMLLDTVTSIKQAIQTRQALSPEQAMLFQEIVREYSMEQGAFALPPQNVSPSLNPEDLTQITLEEEGSSEKYEFKLLSAYYSMFFDIKEVSYYLASLSHALTLGKRIFHANPELVSGYEELLNKLKEIFEALFYKKGLTQKDFYFTLDIISKFREKKLMLITSSPYTDAPQEREFLQSPERDSVEDMILDQPPQEAEKVTAAAAPILFQAAEEPTPIDVDDEPEIKREKRKKDIEEIDRGLSKPPLIKRQREDSPVAEEEALEDIDPRLIKVTFFLQPRPLAHQTQ